MFDLSRAHQHLAVFGAAVQQANAEEFRTHFSTKLHAELLSGWRPSKTALSAKP
jgi:hypothetical protein